MNEAMANQYDLNANPETCELCPQIDFEATNCDNARRLGVSESTIRRHKSHYDPFANTFPFTPSNTSHAPATYQEDYFTGIPQAIVSTRGKTVRLPDGSYEKITFHPNRAVIEMAKTYDDLAPYVDKPLEPAPNYSPYPSLSHGLVVNLADAQIGKANQRGGGTKDTLGRVNECLGRVVDRVLLERPQTVVLVDNGDIIENIFNVPTQKVTNDCDPVTQFRLARQMMRNAIDTLAPFTNRLIVVGVPSNHGQARFDFKSAAGTVDADYGLEINRILEELYAVRPGFEYVEFVRPDPLYETAVVKVAGTKIAFHHGHQAKGQSSQSAWWSGQDHGRMPGWDADILVTAHFHNMGLTQSGNGRWIIHCASVEPDSDYFTNRTGERSQRGMTVFNVLDGQWSGLDLL